MKILKDAAQKIKAFNDLPNDDPRDYHLVLLARGGEKSLVDRHGNVSDKLLAIIDKALRGYFMMNRGNRMGSKEEFVNKLRNKLASYETRRILATLRAVTIVSPTLEDYRSEVEKLYESLSNREDGLSMDGSYFCVGTTKAMHCLLPELFVMLDQNVGKAVLEYSAGQYNNFASYWKVMKICRDELLEWRKLYGSTDSLLKLDYEPTTLTRIFDKCAFIMAYWQEKAERC
jgi:hypothetical protein